MDRRRVWRARALPPSPLFGASRTRAGRQTEKMVNKYAAIVYIRLNASMIKPKKNRLNVEMN